MLTDSHRNRDACGSRRRGPGAGSLLLGGDQREVGAGCRNCHTRNWVSDLPLLVSAFVVHDMPGWFKGLTLVMNTHDAIKISLQCTQGFSHIVGKVTSSEMFEPS